MIKGLPRRHLRPMVIALLILASCACMAGSAETATVIYSTDFSSDPAWVTNNPYTNHWDQVLGTYQYSLRPATNTFVYKKIPYSGESFRLEYDLYPLETEFQSSFRFGLGNRDMSINQGTTILSQFENGSYGNIMWIRIIDQRNQRREVSSYGQSYGGPSVRFTDGIPYHVVVEYSTEQRTASIAVSFLSNGSTLWGYTLSDISDLGIMDRLYLSTIGDFGNPSAVADGEMDNVLMRAVVPSTEPVTTPGVPVTATITGGETRTPHPTLPLTHTIPVPSPTKTPVPDLLAVTALAGAALLFLILRRV